MTVREWPWTAFVILAMFSFKHGKITKSKTGLMEPLAVYSFLRRERNGQRHFVPITNSWDRYILHTLA